MPAFEFSPTVVLTKVASEISNLSPEQVNEYKHWCVANDVIKANESENCKTGGQFFTLLTYRDETQIEKTLDFFCEDPINKSLKQKVEYARIHGVSSLENKSQYRDCIQNISAKSILKKKYSIMAGCSVLVVVVLLFLFKSGVTQTTNVNVNVGNGHSETKPTTQPILPLTTTNKPPVRNVPSVDNMNDPQKNFIPPTIPSIPNSSKDVYSEIELLSYFKKPALYYIFLDSVHYPGFLAKSLCNENSRKGLSLSLFSPFENEDFKIPCTNLISGLELSGNMNLNNVIQILNNSVNIDYFHIDGANLIVDDYLPNLIDHLFLPNLKFVKVSNIGNDFVPLFQILEKVATKNLNKFMLDNVTIQITNSHLIQNTIIKSNLTGFSFNGTLCPNCEFNETVSDSYLKVLRFKVRDKFSSSSGLPSIKSLIQTNSLQYFDSNVEIPSEDRKLFRKLRNVIIVNCTIGLRDTITRYSINSVLILFPNVIQVRVQLEFKNSSVCKSRKEAVSITNLKAIGNSKISKLEIAAPCKLVAVKGWLVKCREYSYQKSKNLQLEMVRIVGANHTDSCKEFWGLVKILNENHKIFSK